MVKRTCFKEKRWEKTFFGSDYLLVEGDLELCRLGELGGDVHRLGLGLVEGEQQGLVLQDVALGVRQLLREAKNETKQNKTTKERSIVFELLVSLPFSFFLSRACLGKPFDSIRSQQRGKEQLKDSFSIEARSFFTSSSDFS
eukprot:COSAG06_NODE_17315_length_948_cov_1.360424_1_plen_142_part_00